VAERLKAAVLKTVRPERVSWVRIPPPPPNLGSCFQLVDQSFLKMYLICTGRFFRKDRIRSPGLRYIGLELLLS
jgi:hypothetical protein